jgi:hypothetical protein
VRTACKPTENIRQWYSNLTGQVGVSEARQRQDARDQYRTALKPLSKAPKDIFAWLSNRERAISFAKEKGVAEVQYPTDWFADFAITVKLFMDRWMTAYPIEQYIQETLLLNTCEQFP